MDRRAFMASFGLVPNIELAMNSEESAAEHDIVSVRAMGGRGDGVTLEDPFVLKALAAAGRTDAGISFGPGRWIISADILLTNVSRFVVEGSGPQNTVIVMTGNKAIDGLDHFGFSPRGTCDRLAIRNLRITSSLGTSTSGQNGIASPSGQTITNMTVWNVEVDNTILGISFNAYPSGAFTGGVIGMCNVHDIKGSSSGAGYGYHLARCYNVHLVFSKADNCGRHSIYHGWTDPGTHSGNLIACNIITNHRRETFDAGYRPAIAISRSNGVVCDTNMVKDGYDGALEISHDTSMRMSCSNISVSRLFCIGRRNLVPYVLIGEQMVPTTVNTTDVDITDSFFWTDQASLRSEDIVVLNGIGIHLNGNTHRHTNVSTPAARRAISLGNSAYGRTSAHIGAISVKGSRFSFSGSSLTDTRCIQVDAPLANTQAALTITGNDEIVGATALTTYTVPCTNTARRIYSNALPDGSKTRTAPLYFGAVAISQGAGSPEGVVVGNPGDKYHRNDGGALTSEYTKETGAATNTGWVAK